MKMLRLRTIQGFDLVPEDLVRALDIYGPSVQGLRGKSMRKGRSADAPPTALGRMIDVDMHLFVDIFFVEGLAFFISVSHPTTN